jgi:hypothetical protein
VNILAKEYFPSPQIEGKMENLMEQDKPEAANNQLATTTTSQSLTVAATTAKEAGFKHHLNNRDFTRWPPEHAAADGGRRSGRGQNSTNW